MNRIPHSLAREEFETLLGRLLWDDLDRYGKKRLLLLAGADPDFAREFRELIDTDDYLRALVPENSGERALVKVDARAAGTPEKQRVLAFALRQRPVTYAAAALLFAAFATLVLAYRGGYLQSQPDVVWTGSCEQVTGQGRETRLRNLPGSAFCDAATRNGSVSLRIFPGSDASILPNDNAPVIFLDQGAALVRGEKRPPGSEIRIFSGANSVRFLGTEVFVRRSDANVQVEVVSGAVEIGRSPGNLIAREMAALPPAERAALVAQDPTFFTNAATEVLSPGETRSIAEDAGSAKDVEQALTRLKKDKLAPKTYLAWRSQLNASERSALETDHFESTPGQISPDRTAILRETWAARAVPQKAIQSETPAVPKVETKLEPARQNKPVRVPEIVRQPARTQDPRPKEADWRDEPHNVIFHDGRTIKGRARQDGDFIIISTDGKETRVPRSDVARIESR